MQPDGEIRALDLAPKPERGMRMVRAMLTGVDLGRSSAMRKNVAEGGLQAGVYAVCVEFWLLVATPLLFVGVATAAVGVHHPLVQDASWIAFGILALCVLASAARWRQMFLARKRFRADPTP